jgi:hypothetical protein
LAKLTEMQGINQLLFEAQFGIKFFSSARESIEIQMKELIRSKGIEKLLLTHQDS